MELVMLFLTFLWLSVKFTEKREKSPKSTVFPCNVACFTPEPWPAPPRQHPTVSPPSSAESHRLSKPKRWCLLQTTTALLCVWGCREGFWTRLWVARRGSLTSKPGEEHLNRRFYINCYVSFTRVTQLCGHTNKGPPGYSQSGET